MHVMSMIDDGNARNVVLYFQVDVTERNIEPLASMQV